MPDVRGGLNTINGAYFGWYSDMKNKYKLKITESFYRTYIDNVTSQMFEWDEKIYRPELLDRLIRDCGAAALIKTKISDYTPVFVNFVGSTLLPDGFLGDVDCYDFAGTEYKFKNWMENPDVLVFFNTPLRTPDMFNAKYADMLTNIDFSIDNNVHYSRQHPVPVAHDKKTKERINQVIKDVSNGDFNTILMDTSIKDILENEGTVEMLNLTDVEKSQYLQYLSHLHDSMISRLFFLLGLGTTDNGKQAQITTEELNKNDDASITMALAWHKARRDAIDCAKEKGHELSFDFSEVWKQRIERITNPPDEQVESTLPEEDGDENVEQDDETDGRTADA